MSDRNVGEPKSSGIKGRTMSGGGRSGGARDGASKGRRGKKNGDIGRALRSVYDETLRENIPGDFLDLLGKLS